MNARKMSRPRLQGRIKKWHILEGVRVKQGDIVLELDDYDPSFMAPDLLALLEQRKKALEDTRKAAMARAEQLDKRINEMRNLVKAAVPSASARVLEADNKVREAYQKAEAARIAVATAELNVDRNKQLAAQGLVSQRELEVSIQAAIATKADLSGALANVKAAEQSMKASSFGRDQVSAEVLQRLLDAEASRDAAVGDAARATDQLADVSLRQSNAIQRRRPGRILAPIDGTMVRMSQAGIGETGATGSRNCSESRPRVPTRQSRWWPMAWTPPYSMSAAKSGSCFMAFRPSPFRPGLNSWPARSAE